MKETFRKLGRTTLAAGMLIAPQIDNPGLSPTYEDTARVRNSTIQTVEQPEVTQPESLRQLAERIDAFTWDDFDNIERLIQFKNELINGYMQVTENSNHDPNELNKNTIFYRSYDKLKEKAKELSPETPIYYDPVEIVSDTQNFTGAFHLVNLEGMDRNLDREIYHPGYFLLDRLWHSWMIEDAVFNEERGKLLNNPDFKIYELDYNQVAGYSGGTMYTEDFTNLTLANFHDYLAHAVSTSLIIEKLGIDINDLDGFGRIHQEFMPPEADDIFEFSQSSGLTSNEFYGLFSKSRLEEILKMLGRNVIFSRIEDDELDKVKIGEDLYNGFRYAQVMDYGYDQSNLEISDMPVKSNNTA